MREGERRRSRVEGAAPAAALDSGHSSLDSEDFIAQLAGLFRDCERLAASAQQIMASAEARVESIRRNGFLRLAELGDGLLRVDAERPGEFEAWFKCHRAQLPFSLRTAYRCKASARLVLEQGIEAALAEVLGRSERDRPEPFLALRICLPVSPDEIPDSKVPEYLERFRPAAEAFHTLEHRAQTLSSQAA